MLLFTLETYPSFKLVCIPKYIDLQIPSLLNSQTRPGQTEPFCRSDQKYKYDSDENTVGRSQKRVMTNSKEISTVSNTFSSFPAEKTHNKSLTRQIDNATKTGTAPPASPKNGDFLLLYIQSTIDDRLLLLTINNN